MKTLAPESFDATAWIGTLSCPKSQVELLAEDGFARAWENGHRTLSDRCSALPTTASRNSFLLIVRKPEDRFYSGYEVPR